jgi:hypothetical protein
MPRSPKRPRDPNHLAKAIADLATADVPPAAETAKTASARKAGVKGGAARAKALTPQQRAEIATLAASARWKKG